MGLYDFVNRFKQTSQWLPEEQWVRWGLIGLAALLAFMLLLKIARRRRRQPAGGMYVDHYPSGGGRMDAAGRSPSMQVYADPAELVSHPEISIRQLRREIFKRDQVEARLEHQIEELKTANQQLRKRITESKEKCAHFEQKLAELTAVAKRVSDTPAKKNGNAAEKQPPSDVEILPEAVEEADQKQCRKCKKSKPLTEFHKNASSHDGLARWCKACKTKAAKESRQRSSSAKRSAQQPAEMCADAPLCVLHHRQTDRVKNVRRHTGHATDKIQAARQPEHRSHRFRSQLSSPGMRCPRRQKQRDQGNTGNANS